MSPKGPRLVLATRNDHKVSELREILGDSVPGIAEVGVLVSAAMVDGPEVAEDGVSFEANALLKARALVAHTGLPALADDSGVCVQILHGAPGIFSARWVGRHGDDQANLQLLLDQLADIAPEHRQAWFECAAVLVMPGGQEYAATGRMEGYLATEPHGSDGFGYDPIFVPDAERPPHGRGRSCAELTASEKNAISHRGIAFRALAPHIADVLR